MASSKLAYSREDFPDLASDSDTDCDEGHVCVGEHYSDGDDEDDDEDASSSSSSQPLSTSDTSDFSLTSDSSDAGRLYDGKPCRTMLLMAERRRVPTLKRRLEVPNVGKKKQARNGQVKAFTPKPYGNCCLRRCCKYFTDPDDPSLKLAREPLYDTAMTRPAMRDALQKNAVNLLVNPCDGKPVCNKMACLAYSCSTSFLNPNVKRCHGTQGDSNRRRAKMLFSVMSWFQNEKELSDVMPDTGVHLLSYPRKVAVYDRYIADVAEVTRCSTCPLGKSGAAAPCLCPHAQKVYLRVSESYFYEIWIRHFRNCQIRKHMRFSKCCFCVKWRSVRNNRKKSERDRIDAKARLHGHYDWIARERGEEISKVWRKAHTHIFFRMVHDRLLLR